jgi:hypothetical protein
MIAPATQIALNAGLNRSFGRIARWMPPGARLSLHFSTGKTGDET